MGQITVGPYYTGPYYSGPNYSRAKLPMGQITVGLKTGPSFFHLFANSREVWYALTK